MLLGIWGVIVAVTGGVDTQVFGVAIRSRDPFRAMLASLILFSLVSLVYRAEFTTTLDGFGIVLRRYAVMFAFAGAAALAAHGIAFGSFSVGGSDAYGYVNQAYDWVEGRLPRPLPLPLALPFETSDEMQIPLGYRRGHQPHTMVPTYAPGLPLLMAVALVVAGTCGPFLVVPVSAALFVWFTYQLGCRAGGSAVGVVAVLALVTSPVVLFQALSPMSDVPAGAIWTAAIVLALGPSRRNAAAAGFCAALGLLMRPNLPLVAAVPLLAVVLRAGARERWVRAVAYCAPIVPVVIFVAVLNAMWYGGPSNTGYGSTGELYHASNIWPNLKRYASWLWASQSPWLLLALLPLLPPFTRTLNRGVLAVCVLLGIATFSSYASYYQFDAWWYLRFLMPAFGAFAVLLAAGIVAIARTIPQPFGRVAAAAALYMMIATTVSFASRQLVFGGMRAGERRYMVAGDFVADHLPANAAILAMQHSGSLRFYSGRLSLRYDWVQPEWASRVPATIERAGYHPYLLIDDSEIPDVRRQFNVPADAPLPWPVFAHTSELAGMTIFDLATAPGPPSPIPLQPVTHDWCARRRAPI